MVSLKGRGTTLQARKDLQKQSEIRASKFSASNHSDLIVVM